LPYSVVNSRPTLNGLADAEPTVLKHRKKSTITKLRSVDAVY